MKKNHKTICEFCGKTPKEVGQIKKMDYYSERVKVCSTCRIEAKKEIRGF